jgi:hypothetical protein
VLLAIHTTPSPSPTVAVGPTLSPNPKGSGPEPDRHAAPELEALIPPTIAGVAFATTSFNWDAGSLNTLTQLVGKRPENVCYAYGMPGDPSRLPVGILVYRIVGVSALQLRAAMLRAWNGLTAPPGEQTVGGKQVIMVELKGSAMLCCSNGPEYLYAQGEALFVILPANSNAAATALRGLP